LAQNVKWDGPFFVNFFLNSPEQLHVLQPISRDLDETVLEADHRTGHVKIRFRLGDGHCNYNKRVHGGITALLLDEATGVAAFAYIGDRFKATVESKISYLRSLKPGEIFAEARVVHSTPSFLFLEAAIIDEKGNQFARSSSTIAVAAKDSAPTET
jgi:uncharacterized protein (TIGR00369 family)